MDNQKIIEFFDEMSSVWDRNMVIDPENIGIIFDQAEVKEGKDVLDVACGTGVLFPFYEERHVASLTGIDISPKMCEIVRTKGDHLVFTGDAATFEYPQKYDVILIYNAFPHISDPEGFIAHMSACLKEGGVFSIAHGMSRQMLIKHHERVDSEVAAILPEMEELAAMMGRYLDVFAKTDNEKMFQICGRKK